ncbi:MAG: hypothetical protein HKO62_03550 [Gammaproteobacteria bacterium]|nr:hypothetical protein [Gammaproteobacteria bacterium]NNL99801.1 hypothetical protein [Gammaproteobacteria bacterium]
MANRIYSNPRIATRADHLHVITLACLFVSLAMHGITAPAQEGAHGSAAHRHHLSAYIGGTTVNEGDHTGFTLGVDYEYVVNQQFGIGFVAEHAFDDVDATSVFAVIDLHLTEAAVLQVGPGIEFEGDEEFIVGRIGAYYELGFGSITAAPSLFFDYSGETTAIVYGLIIGRKF